MIGIQSPDRVSSLDSQTEGQGTGLRAPPRQLTAYGVGTCSLLTGVRAVSRVLSNDQNRR